MFSRLKTCSAGKLVFFTVLVLFTAGMAASTTVKDAEIVDKVDRDDDGKLSDFSVEITADLRIDEAGAKYGDDVVPGKVDFSGIVGEYLEPKGDPKFNVWMKSGGQHHRMDIWASPGHRENEKETTFKAEYDYRDVENMIKQSNANWVRGTEKAVEGERKITGLWVKYYETDTCNDCESALDTIVEFKKIKLDDPIRLEKPSKDEEKEVAISSNTDAEVYINGDRKGKTPWEGGLPVDISEDELVDVRLEKDGYVTKTAKEDLNPPASRNYQLKKVKKPLVVDSEPQGADVLVNGQKIGETPVSEKYWVEKDLDITVENSENSSSFSDINTPWSKTVDLNGTKSSGGSTGGLYFDYGLNFDTQYYDNLMTDLPDLEGLTMASFNRSEKRTNPGENVKFDASGSYSLYRNITEYRWDFGNGDTRRGKAPEITYSYSSPGNYTVNLTVVNDNGTKHSTTKYVNVENLKPKPDFSIPGKRIEAGDAVKFNAGPSIDTDGKIQAYKWKTGDGGTLRGQTATYAYSSAGTYTVELEVIDQYGASSTTTRTVKIEKPNVNPSASFQPSKNTVKTGETVSFDASSSSDPEGSISTYAWDLGDGYSKTGQQISYNYSQPGTYNVELNVVDSAGATASVSKTITVQGSNQQPSGDSSDQEETSSSQENRSGSQNQEESGQKDQSSSGESSGSAASETGSNESSESTEETGSIGTILIELIRAIF